MANLAPIGSIVRVKDVLLVVVGHRMARDEQAIGLCYVLVPYPLGFVSAANLSLMPVRLVDEVVCAGYVTDEGTKYLEELSDVAESAEGVGYHDYADAVLAFDNYLKEGANDE